MEDFKINILGCGSASPSMRHMPSCQAIEYRGRVFMIDCGEGAQLAYMHQRLKFSRLTDIFISHLHGDHLLGLPGLLSTMALHSVGGQVNIHIFKAGADLIKQILKVTCHDTGFKVNYNIITPGQTQTLLDLPTITVTSFPLHHTTAAVGFRFDQKPNPRHINGPMAKFHSIPHWAMNNLKAGLDYTTPQGTVIPNAVLTSAPTPNVSYAYASDTAFSPAVARAVSGVDLLYHEATYGDDKEAQSALRGHSTARQAARIASMAHVGQLLIGHFSKSIDDAEQLRQQALEEFPDVIAANEGLVVVPKPRLATPGTATPANSHL